MYFLRPLSRAILEVIDITFLVSEFSTPPPRSMSLEF